MAQNRTRNDGEDPPEYRFINEPIIPPINLLNTTTLPDAHPNIGECTTTIEYLSTMFYFFREDFITPLRIAVEYYVSLGTPEGQHPYIDAYREPYNKYKIQKITRGDRMYELAFQVDDESGSNTIDPEMLKGSSLLALSDDRFRTAKYVVVDWLNRARHFMPGDSNYMRVVAVDEEELVFANNDNILAIEPVTYFASYRPILEKLQNFGRCMMNESLGHAWESPVPFAQYLMRECQDMDFPAYFDDDVKIKINGRKIKMKTIEDYDRVSDDGSQRSYAAATDAIDSALRHLDISQREAICHALTNEVVLIEGPAGTGKSFVGIELLKILMDNKEIWARKKGGRICVISFTNPAIDQFLLESVKSGVNKDKFLRLGWGFCEEVKNFTLDAKNREIETGENRLVKDLTKRIRILINTLGHPQEAEDRGRSEKLKQLEQYLKEKSDLQHNMQMSLMLKAEILVLTTTLASKYGDVIFDTIKPEIIIIDEAGQIPEPHMIAALTSWCKHLILMGDQKQLKPITSEWLNPNYRLDVSLFERLVDSHFTSVQLDLQYRMHPDIASTLVPHIYPQLRSHPKVEAYPPVRGIDKRIVFIQNESEERLSRQPRRNPTKNTDEVHFIGALCMYLLQQGYKKSEITILTFHIKQVNTILDHLEHLHINPQGDRRKVPHYRIKGPKRRDKYVRPGIENRIHATTVGMYQGQQNNIVLVSFVSSAINIKYMEPNRLCSLLSCAMHGFYAIGNFYAYTRDRIDEPAYSQKQKEDVLLWKEMVNDWESKGKFSLYLPIRCTQHAGPVHKIFSGAHFEQYAPNNKPQCSQCINNTDYN